MKTLHKRITSTRLLAAVLAMLLMVMALPLSSLAAVSSQEVAVDYLVYAGIYRGDENGNLNLDKGLTRAELAVILTRWDVNKTGDINVWYATNGSTHKFTDVPAWAAPHVAYC
ncbi:MAG: S-layer homology domain-containing protein, partial [Clostridiales Family XIII bacterium]|nr:S-layer homology domain-containing protein [Clostridiales Family XIII bacterium]